MTTGTPVPQDLLHEAYGFDSPEEMHMCATGCEELVDGYELDEGTGEVVFAEEGEQL